MTNKMKLGFIITTTLSASILVLSTPFAGDICGQILSAYASHEAPKNSTLVALAIPVGLYLVFQKRRHS